MKKTSTILFSILLSAGLFVSPNLLQAQKENKDKKTTEKMGMDKGPDLKSWPEASQKAAKEMMDKYGKPDETTQSMLIWNKNGQWLKTVVYKDEMKHLFPMAHTDVLEQWMNYQVPLELYGEIAKYDGSVTINRTNGTISARCDNEGMNILALNLAADIAGKVKSVEQARTDYGKFAMEFKNGGKPDYTQKLKFNNDKAAPDPDKPLDAMKVGADGK